MHRVLAIALCVVLAGCIGSPVMKSEALSFSDVIEDATNKLLVLNVLRARDKAPLHFADIPVIRESMQQNASLGPIVFPRTVTAPALIVSWVTSLMERPTVIPGFGVPPSLTYTARTM